MIRRCPQCGTTSDDIYGFCYKCGREFSNVQSDTHICPLCGFKNPQEADFCVKCGTPLVFKRQFQEPPDNNSGPIIIKKELRGNVDNYKPHRTSRILIILGYLFSILGGIIGLIIAIYLATRKDPVAKKHGYIQLAIFALYIIIISVLYATGNIPADVIVQYKQLLAGNYTLI
jgi:uncharacterized membrane protein YvbJ